MKHRLTLLLLTLLAGNAARSAPSAEHEVELDWLVGRWCLQDGNRHTTETWLPAAGGVWFGISHSEKDGRASSFEYLRIAPHGETLAYAAQPGGRTPTIFVMTASGVDWVRFENPQHDFPQVIEYRRRGKALLAQIAGPDAAGTPRVIRFSYSTCNPQT